jgi:hypothetical protein
MARRFSCALVLLTTGAALGQPPAGGAKQPAANSELHVVCAHEGYTKTGDMIHGGKAAVKVDRPGKAVTLVVSAYNPVTWDVTVTPGTTLKKVIVAGYHRQAVGGQLNGVEVVEAFREKREGKPSLYAYYNIDSARLRPSIQAIHKLTGMEVRSYQGVYSAKADTPQVVDAVMKDDRLSSDYPKVTPAADLPKFKVQAVRLIPDRYDLLASFGEFGATGPDAESLKPLPAGIRQVVYDPAGKKYYGVTVHDVNEIDLTKGKAIKLDEGLDVPKIQSVRALAFDTKRGRLFAIAAHRNLYEYTPATGAWRVVVELPRGVEVGALVHYAKEDALYGLGVSMGGEEERSKPTLFRLNAQGAVTDKIALGEPMFPGLVGHPWISSHLQLIDSEDRLVAVVTRTGRFSEEGGEPESFVYLIDPKTEKVQLAWKKTEAAVKPK